MCEGSHRDRKDAAAAQCSQLLLVLCLINSQLLETQAKVRGRSLSPFMFESPLT